MIEYLINRWKQILSGIPIVELEYLLNGSEIDLTASQMK